MRKLFKNYTLHFTDRNFLASFFAAWLMFALALIVNFYAGTYATIHASNSVTDLILSNIPVFDVDGLFVYGAIVLVAFITLLCILNPRKIPFTLKTISLFILTRALFVTLTHLGPYPNETPIALHNIISKFSFDGDLFFSGHTGLPYLMALVYWGSRPLRLIFLAASLFFAIVVLLGHLHYSIDVLGAFFITYTIFHLAEIFFKKDLAASKQESSLKIIGTPATHS